MSIVFDHPLADYVSPEEHTEHARVAKLVAEYHEAKAMAMKYRLKGDIEAALPWEAECERVAKEIEGATS